MGQVLSHKSIHGRLSHVMNCHHYQPVLAQAKPSALAKLNQHPIAG
jgi:hypothetical protein